MTASRTCPDESCLRQLLDAGTQPELPVELARHLEACAECRQKLEELASGGEGLAELAELADTVRCEQDRATPVPPGLVETLKSDRATVCVGSDQLDTTEMLKRVIEPSAEVGHLGRLRSYEVLEVIGQGGMGIVLKAHDARLNRDVAIKVLAPQLAVNADARRRFLREAQAAAAVSHDHVIAIHAVDEAGGLPFLVMEYIAGVSLEELLRLEGPLPVERILRIGMQAALGLAAAHAQGLVHRDIKPSNILLEKGGERVKISDFGLARAVDDQRGITRNDVVAGTPEYMSPEQARGEGVDQRSDLFSLGCVLYAMCTGRSPFQAKNVVDSLRRVCDDPPRAIRQVNPDIPDWLAEIIDRLLEKDAGLRFPSAAELGDLLERGLAHVQAPCTLPAPGRLPRPARRKPGLRARRLWIFLAAMVIGAAFLAVTDALEVTSVAQWLSTVLRIRTPNGVLVVKIEDPQVKVAVDGAGETITLTGIGDHVIELRPGTHAYRVLKDGEVARNQWVTITRGGKEVVTVGPEPTSSKTAALPPPERSSADHEVDLLAMVDPLRDASYGAWWFNGGLSAASREWAFLGVPYLVPEQYDLALTIERSAGDGPFGIGIMLDNRPCSICLDWKSADATVSSIGVLKWGELELIGKGVRGKFLPLGQRVKVLCSVRGKGPQHQIGLYVNDQLVYDWEGSVAELTPDQGPPDPFNARCVRLWHKAGGFHITRLTLRPVSGRGKAVFTGPSAPVDRQIAEHVLWKRLGTVFLSVDGSPTLERRNVEELPPVFRLTGMDVHGPLSPVVVSHLSKASNLERLVLRGHGPFHEALAYTLLQHPTLKKVDLANGTITGEMLERIARLPHLQDLNLSFTKVGDPDLAKLTRCKTLQRLLLARTQASDAGAESIAELSRLEELDVSSTRITAEGLKRIAGLKKLKKLAIDFLPVDDEGARAVLAHAQLSRLSLARSNVTDGFLAGACRLHDLRGVSLAGTKVSQEGINALQQALPNCHVEHDLQTAVDLLSLVKPERDGVAPGWSKQDNVLVSPSAGWDSIRIPYTPPNDYVLRLTARRESGSDALFVGLVVGGRPCFLTLSTNYEGCRSGLEWIDGYRINQNESAYVGEPITTGKPLTVYVIVRGSSVRAALDHQLLVDWSGAPERLSVPLQLLKSPDKILSLGTFRSVYRISEMKLTPLPVLRTTAASAHR